MWFYTIYCTLLHFYRTMVNNVLLDYLSSSSRNLNNTIPRRRIYSYAYYSSEEGGGGNFVTTLFVKCKHNIQQTSDVEACDLAQLLNRLNLGGILIPQWRQKHDRDCRRHFLWHRPLPLCPLSLQCDRSRQQVKPA